MQGIYLNTASTGLVPSEFTNDANRLQSEFAQQGSTAAERWRDEQQPIVRQAVADFLDATTDSIALVPNFSWAMNGIIHSLRGDEKVMLYEADYPSLTEPFKINGFDIVWINDVNNFSINMQELQAKLLSEKVELIAISHVQWLSGFKIDLAELGRFCRQHDIWLIVDATQSLGAINIHPIALDIDVLISSNYKWMNAGFGTGVMYMSHEFFNVYTPKVGGNNSYAPVDGVMSYMPSVRSFEPGHPNMYGFSLLHAAIRHKVGMGIDTIEAHNRNLTQQLLDGISGLNVSLIGDDNTTSRASMVFLRDDGSLLPFIKSNGITVSGRMGHVRISIHYYNTEADVQALVDVLKEY